MDEIVRLIAYELVASRGQATAVALACCCKSFEDPVLDALWEAQERLLPLLKLLPGDVWTGGYKSFRRLPTKPEWARFRKYALRMRKLNESLMQDLPPSQVLSVLQFRAISEPLLPNLKTFLFWPATGELTSFIPSLLSPRTTAIDIGFIGSNHPKAVIASMITTLPTLYPNLQKISLSSLPRDPIIVAATSELLLSTNRDAIRSFCATSPLTEEAREVISKLPDLCELHMVVDGPASLPTLILPNLTDISVEFNHDHDWLEGFREATLGKLASVTFTSDSDLIGDFLEAFKSVALTTSISETLSTFKFCTPSPWRPNYHSLLSFVHLEDLEIEFSCEGGCSSTVDDDTIINLAQTMPKLRYLYLGDSPCQTPTGVTVKGLTALAYYCRRLWMLRVHFQVDSLNPQEDLQVISGPGSTILRGDCALSDLHVGEIHVPKGSVLMVALTLLRIFPNLENIEYASEECEQVADAIWHSKQLTDRSRAMVGSAI